MQENAQNTKFAIFWIIIGTLGRLIPHPANVTPMAALALFSGSKLSKKMALLTIAITMLASDALLAYLNHYPVFSFWSLFTYSGFLGITLLGIKLNQHSSQTKILSFVLAASLGFWLWTNFGVWLTSGLYAKNIIGITTCYIAALPFLRNELLGSLAWQIIIFGGYRLLFVKRQKIISNCVNSD
jgi:hypothetical protein